MYRAKTPEFLSAFKVKWLYKIPLLIMAILNSHIGFNEHRFNIGGIRVVSGRPIEGNCDSKSAENATSDSGEATGIYQYLDMNDVVKMGNCTKASSCPASEKYLIVCGSDGLIYQNIGVLLCAQSCKKDLKLANFGPCDGADPLHQSTLPPITKTTTKVNYYGINVDPASQANFDEKEDRKLWVVLKERIRETMKDHPLPPEWKEWCKTNRDKCYYGFHPNYNPALYLIPVGPNNPLDLWQKEHEQLTRRSSKRLNPN